MTYVAPTLTEVYPPYAIIVRGTYLGSPTAVTAHVWLSQDGQPFVTQDGKYLASQGL